jgi:aspartate racemase
MHIGMIGGIGPAATEFYYRHLVDRYRSAGQQMELTMVHADVNQLVTNMTDGLPDEQTRIYVDLAMRLRSADADAIVITSISGHFCISEFEKVSPLPIISILPALDAEFRQRNLRRVGLLGTTATMRSRLFGGISGTEIVTPLGEDFDRVNDTYLELAMSGKVNQEQRELLFRAGKDLCVQQGAEAVLLAGTDLFLAFDGYDCGFEAIDGALVHIDAVFRRSITGSG